MIMAAVLGAFSEIKIKPSLMSGGNFFFFFWRNQDYFTISIKRNMSGLLKGISLFLFSVQGFSIHELMLKLLCTDTFGNNCHQPTSIPGWFHRLPRCFN